MKLTGKAHRFVPNDDINTDYIISGRYKFKIDDMNELAKHVMEDIDPEFASKVSKGDFVVAGRNFGCRPNSDGAGPSIPWGLPNLISTIRRPRGLLMSTIRLPFDLTIRIRVSEETSASAGRYRNTSKPIRSINSRRWT